MDQKEVIWIKEEKADAISIEPWSMSLEDPLKTEEPNLHVKQDGEMKLCGEDSRHNIPEDVLQIEEPSPRIKQDQELNLCVDYYGYDVVAPTRCDSGSTRLIQNSGESCGILFEEAVNQRVVHNDWNRDAEQSTHFTMFDTCTQGLVLQEDNSHDTRQKCSLRENEFYKFSCSSCLQSFPSKYRLIMHVFKHIDGVQPPIYVCNWCGEVFPSNVSLNKHRKMSEGDEVLFAGNNEKFDCSDDSKNIKFLEGDINVPVTEQTEKQTSSKEICVASKKSFNMCNTHNVTHDPEKQHRHPNYGESSITCNANALGVQHTAKTHHKCDICGKCFTRLGHLKNHSLIHSGIRPHKCDTCGKSYVRFGELKRHSLIHTGMKPHKCVTCGKSFTRFGALKRHTLIHTGMKPHKCVTCGKSFTQLVHLKNHALSHTGMRLHKCDVCGKSFARLGELKRHALIHTGMKPHGCVTCGKSFNQLDHLKIHALTHTGMKLHKCDICGKSFNRFGVLKRHALIHTGMKPHKCDICGKSFSLLTSLKTHELIHTGKKPHKCDICGKSFTWSCSLKKHTLTHPEINLINDIH